MNDFLIILFAFIFFAHLVFLGISFYNLIKAPRIKNINPSTGVKKLISILIPARNEETNINNLLESITNLSSQNYEVFILDDESEDNTFRIIEDFSGKNKKIKGIKGEKLPGGWTGKNWACHQLAAYAKGEWLLFLDADVILTPESLSFAAGMAEQYEVDMLSCFPTQRLRSIGEWFIVPLMNWLLLTFLPLKRVMTSKNKNIVAANGQYILFNRQRYFEIGGHESVKSAIVEDMELARRIKQNGYKCLTALGDNAVYCSMYSSFREAFRGFSKNFFPGFIMAKPAFIILISILMLLFAVPFGLIFIDTIFIMILIEILIERLFVSVCSRQNWLFNFVLHPFQMIIMSFIGINSLFKKEQYWKGRKINLADTP